MEISKLLRINPSSENALHEKEEVSGVDVMAAEAPVGTELLDKVVSLTGLPPELVEDELAHILTTSGHSGEGLTLEDLRSAMVAYLDSLQEVLLAEDNDAQSLEK